MRLEESEEQRDSSAGHVPVLPQEVLDALSPQPKAVYVDLTAGRGGHAARVAKVVGPAGRVVL
ncbi:MAG: MraW methylase family, partial [Planctomycetota bacterium]